MNRCRPPARSTNSAPRPQPQMVGIAKQDFTGQILHFFRGHAFDGTLGADRHEDGSLNRAMRGMQSPSSSGRSFVGMQNFKGADHLFLSVLPIRYRLAIGGF